jgi:hypothetical protein
MIAAHVYREDGQWNVSLSLNGRGFDTAGPFEDEYDATEAARRMGDEVYPADYAGCL